MAIQEQLCNKYLLNKLDNNQLVKSVCIKCPFIKLCQIFDYIKKG